jgi:short-subunit dehydrogenase
MDPNNKKVLITGASAGIGKEFAIQLHARGCEVILVARRAALLADLCAALNHMRPDSARMIVADLTDSKTFFASSELMTCLRESKPDILINNAGRGSFGEYADIALSDELALLDLNVRAPLQLIHGIVPNMRKQGRGAIINISSIAGYQPLPFMASYGASKAFLSSFSHALAFELRQHGIQVLLVCPGPVATEFGGVARVPGEFTGISRDSVETIVRNTLAALKANQTVTHPSYLSWGLSLLCRWLPTWLTRDWVGKTLRRSLELSKGIKN